jgi:hypothetical protein
MLVNSNLYLANCDSVNKRSNEEFRKRVVWGLAFAEKIILTPNIIIDNISSEQAFKSRNVLKYLIENPGKIILRHNHTAKNICFSDYFSEREDGYVFSGVDGSPRKCDMSHSQKIFMEKRMDNIDVLFDQLGAEHDPMYLEPDLLSTQVRKMIDEYEKTIKKTHTEDCLSDKDFDILRSFDGLHSRSEWYKNLKDNYGSDTDSIAKICSEIVDPAYNNVMTRQSEAFATDIIKPGFFPEIVLFEHAYHDELGIAKNIFNAIRFVHTLGVDGVMSWLIDYSKEKGAEYIYDHGSEFIFATQAWNGMHNKMLKHIGVGIKQ